MRIRPLCALARLLFCTVVPRSTVLARSQQVSFAAAAGGGAGVVDAGGARCLVEAYDPPASTTQCGLDATQMTKLRVSAGAVEVDGDPAGCLHALQDVVVVDRDEYQQCPTQLEQKHPPTKNETHSNTLQRRAVFTIIRNQVLTTAHILSTTSTPHRDGQKCRKIHASGPRWRWRRSSPVTRSSGKHPDDVLPAAVPTNSSSSSSSQTAGSSDSTIRPRMIVPDRSANDRAARAGIWTSKCMHRKGHDAHRGTAAAEDGSYENKAPLQDNASSSPHNNNNNNNDILPRFSNIRLAAARPSPIPTTTAAAGAGAGVRRASSSSASTGTGTSGATIFSVMAAALVGLGALVGWLL